MDLKTKVSLGTVLAVIPAIGVWFVNDHKLSAQEKELEEIRTLQDSDHDKITKLESGIENINEKVEKLDNQMAVFSSRQMEQNGLIQAQTAILQVMKEQLEKLE
jgi:septal ring factor EnvC (AmiA/AmiB activator)